MGFMYQIKTHPYRAFKCLCVSLLFTGIGFHIGCYIFLFTSSLMYKIKNFFFIKKTGAFGPSLIDLAIQIDETIDKVTRVLPVRGNLYKLLFKLSKIKKN